MNQQEKLNSEYMAVLTEVVHCLMQQLHHPKLSMDENQITDWFHHVSAEQVREVLRRMEAVDRTGGGTGTSQP